MTSNDDTAAPEGKGTPPVQRTRKRQPPIIDLARADSPAADAASDARVTPASEAAAPEAASVESKDAAASGPTGPELPGAMPPEPPSEPPTVAEPETAAPAEPAAAADPVRPAASGSGGSGSLGTGGIVVTAVVAAILGGAVALGGGYALVASGRVSLPVETRTAIPDLVEARLGALEASNAGAGDAAARLAALAGNVQADHEALGQLGTSVENLSAELKAAVAAAPDRAALDEATSRVVAVEGRLQDLAGRIDALAPLSARVGAAEATDADLAKRIADLNAEVETLARGVRAANVNGEAATAFALSSLERAVDDGGSFTAELTLLSGRVGPELTAPLEGFAVGGVPTRAAIAGGFEAAENAILATAEQPVGDSYLDRLLADARALVHIRPTGPIPGDDVEAVTSRLKAAVESGDLPGALKLWQGLPEPARKASAEWAALLKARVDAEAAVAKLSDAVLTKAAATSSAATPPAAAPPAGTGATP